MKVCDAMTRDVWFANPGQTIQDAAKTMSANCTAAHWSFRPPSVTASKNSREPLR
jgi:hypothetical protein